MRGWDESIPGRPFSTIGPLPAGHPDFTVHIGDLYAALMSGPYVATFTLMVRRSAGEAPQFAEDLPIYEDWSCFARLARAGHAAAFACETAWNYGHAGPRVTRADTLTMTTCRITLLQRFWGADAAYLAVAGRSTAACLRSSTRSAPGRS